MTVCVNRYGRGKLGRGSGKGEVGGGGDGGGMSRRCTIHSVMVGGLL